MQGEKIFTDYLKKDGLKITNQRISILKCLKFLKCHFNADDIYDFLKKSSAKVSRASVYRMIPSLKKNGIIKEVGRDINDKIIYEYIKDVPHHDHLICIKCGRTIEFMDEGMEELQRSICKKYNFSLVEHKMELKGICKNCLRKKR